MRRLPPAESRIPENAILFRSRPREKLLAVILDFGSRPPRFEIPWLWGRGWEIPEARSGPTAHLDLLKMAETVCRPIAEHSDDEILQQRVRIKVRIFAVHC